MNIPLDVWQILPVLEHEYQLSKFYQLPVIKHLIPNIMGIFLSG